MVAVDHHRLVLVSPPQGRLLRQTRERNQFRRLDPADCELVFLTNIWVSETTMPGWLQAIVKVNPVTRLVIAVRELMAGTASVTNIGWALLSCAALIIVFTPITLHLYNKKLRT